MKTNTTIDPNKLLEICSTVTKSISAYREVEDKNTIEMNRKMIGWFSWRRLETDDEVSTRLGRNMWSFDYPCIEGWGSLDVAAKLTKIAQLAIEENQKVIISADDWAALEPWI